VSPAPAAALLALLAVLTSGCAQFGPFGSPPADEVALPTLGLKADDRFGAADAAQAAPTPQDLHWWRRFDDPELAGWVERALIANVDIAIAAERVQQARALLRSAGARRGPTLGVGADATLALRRADGERRVQPGAALTLDFDTDLWGGLRAAERAAAAGAQRSVALRQGARLQAASLTARAYIEWRAAQQDEAALSDALALQREALRIVGIRVEAGLAPVLDRDRATTEVAAIEAERAAAAQRRGQALSALQVLAGERPRVQALQAAEATGAGAVPALRGAQPVSRPLDLLRSRPDLQAAEQALLVAAADTGVAAAELRPRLRLPGSLIFGAVTGGGLLELSRATLAAALELTLFDGGERQAGLDVARSRTREAALVYRQTLLRALQQVEDALMAQQGAQQRIAARRRANSAAVAAEAQAQTLYRAGLSGFLDLLDAQRSVLDNRRALLQAQADAASAAVVAFEAMGLMVPEAPAT
jgi:multidrug efflux system outer membrane protein